MKLNRERILSRIGEIEKLIEKYKRDNRLLFYNAGAAGVPVHEKQLAFHRCDKKNRWVFGGNRSGKTECGAAESVWLARGNHPFKQNRPNVAGWVVSPSRDVQREVAQTKILSYINPDWIVDVAMVSGRASNPSSGIIDFITIKNVLGGEGRICFKSSEMGRDKFQGASLDFVWFDEEPPEDIYTECAMRVVDRSGWIFGTMTPLKGLTFIYDRIYLNDRADDEVWHIFMEWGDNPHLPQREIRLLSASMPKEELESRRYGRFMAAGGMVYSEFDERVHVIDPFDVPREWYDTLSIDPGLNNPLSCHWYACDYDGNIYVIAEHYFAGKDIGWHCARIKAKCRELNWHTDSFGRYSGLIDSAANQRTLASTKSVTELFIENGIQVNGNVDKNVFAGIARVKDYLKGSAISVPDGEDGADVGDVADGARSTRGATNTSDEASVSRGAAERLRPRLYIFRNCVNLVKEMKGYWWGSGDVPRKSNDHALDELRYYIMTKPALSQHSNERRRGRRAPSPVAKDKARLIKRARGRA